MSRAGATRGVWFAIAGVSLAAVGAALVSQYRFDMLPCPWCTLQRLIFLVIAAVALLAALARPLARAGAALVTLLAASGVASAAWQHFFAASSASCNLTLADKIMDGLGLYERLPEVFAPQASCADAAVNLLGLPYAFWSGLLFALIAAVALRQALRRR